MLTYSFQNMGKDSLYEYLYKCIRSDILAGRIRPGEKLPSKRSFARNLGVSVVTVESAYAQLAAEGYIDSRPRSGYYAAHISQELLTPSGAGPRGARAGANAPGASRAGGGGRSAEGKTEIDLVSGSTDPAQFPFTIWARLMRTVLADRRRELMARAPGGGVPALRQAIADYLRQYQGMDIGWEQVIVGAGTEYLYSLLIQLLGRDRVYALEDPGYGKTARVYESHGVETVYIPMDQAGVQTDRLRESEAAVMHISPSHHFPTGVTTSISRRYELLAWAGESRSAASLRMTTDCEFRLAGRPIPSLQSIDRQGRVIYMNTFTRSLTPTIRISYMVLPKRLGEEFQRKLGFYSCTVPNFEQYTLAGIYTERLLRKTDYRMRNYYRARRDELLDALGKSPMGEQVSIEGADAGPSLSDAGKDGPDGRGTDGPGPPGRSKAFLPVPVLPWNRSGPECEGAGDRQLPGTDARPGQMRRCGVWSGPGFEKREKKRDFCRSGWKSGGKSVIVSQLQKKNEDFQGENIVRIIIVGCGKVGETLAAELSQEGDDITVIDRKEDKVERLCNAYDIMGCTGKRRRLFHPAGGGN